MAIVLSIGLALILAPVGYGVGLFSFRNILLPLFYSWPRAERLAREGGMKAPIPITAFVVAPLVWLLVVFGLSLLVYVLFPSSSNPYVVGLLVGAVQAGRLVLRPNASMEEQFVSTYQAYLK